jgi:hypothetical protein
LDVARLTEVPEVRRLGLRLLVAPPIPNGGGNTTDRFSAFSGELRRRRHSLLGPKAKLVL